MTQFWQLKCSRAGLFCEIWITEVWMGFELAQVMNTPDLCTVTHLDSDLSMLRRLSALKRVIILRTRFCMHSSSLKLQSVRTVVPLMPCFPWKIPFPQYRPSPLSQFEGLGISLLNVSEVRACLNSPQKVSLPWAQCFLAWLQSLWYCVSTEGFSKLPR